MATLKNPNIAKANPSSLANDAFINALFVELRGKGATRAELDKFKGKNVKDVTNLILGQQKSPFTKSAVTPLAPEVPSVTGNPTLDNLLNNLQDKVEGLINEGKQINPSIEITPDLTAKWLEQAKTELDPSFNAQIDAALENFRTTAAQNKIQQDQTEQDIAKRYGQDVGATGDAAGESGFASSSIRQKQERELAQKSTQDVDRTRQLSVFNTTQAANAAAREVGSDVFNQQAGTFNESAYLAANPDVADAIRRGDLKSGREHYEKWGKKEGRNAPYNTNAFNFDTTPKFTAGDYRTGTSGARNTPLYTVNPGITGQIELNRKAALRGRTSELESAYRGDRALSFA